MAFHVKTKTLNHSPQWYHNRGLDEDSPPSMVALINADITQLDVMDKTLTPGEKLGDYEEEWNRILQGKDGDKSPAELQEVMERDGLYGNRPVDLYTKPPFSTISRLMEKEGLTTTDVLVFIKWKAKAANVKKARAAKHKKLKPKRDAIKAHQAKVKKLFAKDRYSPSKLGEL